MASVFIVDDEPLAIVKLEHLCKEHDSLEVKATFQDPLLALEKALTAKPDIIFLDISMPELSGLDFIQKISHLNTKVVFVTAFDNHAIDAFEYNACDYLMKPVTKERFALTVSRLTSGSQPEQADEHPMVRFFGKLEIEGCTEKNFKWHTAKVKELFAYFLLNRNREVYRNELAEALWSKLDKSKVVSNINATLYYLRNDLQQLDSGITIFYKDNYYRIDTDSLLLDEDIFANAFAKRNDINDKNIDEMVSALRLCRGELFQDVTKPWINLPRQMYSSRIIELLRLTVDFYIKKGEPLVAGEIVGHMLSVFPKNEQIQAIAMKTQNR